MTMFMTSEDEAEELREEGNALFAKGEYTSACAKYEVCLCMSCACVLIC
jgi:hypothetical protein